MTTNNIRYILLILYKTGDDNTNHNIISHNVHFMALDRFIERTDG